MHLYGAFSLFFNLTFKIVLWWNCNIKISFTVMIQRGKFIFRFTILKWFHSGPRVMAVISTLLHFHFTNFRENHRRYACKMARNELQPGGNAQCPPRLMRAHRSELSTEAFHFYGSAEVPRKSCISTEELHFYGTATSYTTEALDFYGRISRLFP